MPKKESLRYRLRQADIKHFDKLIHDQPKKWLIKNFSKRADEYPVNVSMLMRNIIWQMRERVLAGNKPVYRELIRTFWYSYIKSTLARAGALSQERDQYKDLVSELTKMVTKYRLMKYKDIGFRDNKKGQRMVGGSANIILFSEKAGHQEFLLETADKYGVSALALGGQPSLLNIEYFVDDLKKHKVNLKRSFYLFSIVDYDPSGWIIRDAFIDNLKFYGIANVRVIELIHPDMLKPEEVKISRYPIETGKGMEVKNKKWLKQIRRRQYKNQRYLEQKRIIIEKDKTKTKQILYGLEAEAVSIKRLNARLEEELFPLIGKSENLLKRYELKRLRQSLEDLMIKKLT
jgi:hypothetical protein